MAEAPRTPLVGLQIAIAAVVVNVARLTLAFLEADGIAVAPALRATLLAITGVASGIVLTGGGAYLAHALSRVRRWRRLLAAVWALVLACAALLVTPALVAGLAGSELSVVLGTAALRWTWSSTAVLAVELVAAGSMVAYAVERLEGREAAEAENELLALARERNQLAARLNDLQTRPVPPTRRHRRTVRRPPTGRAADPRPCRHGCGFVGKNAMAERGHLKSCPRRPRTSHRQPTTEESP